MVGTIKFCMTKLIYVVDGYSEELVRSEQAAGDGHRYVVLSYVDAVGINRQGNIDTVIDQEGCSHSTAQGCEGSGSGHHDPGGSVFATILDHPHTSTDSPGNHLSQGTGAHQNRVGDQIHPPVYLVDPGASISAL